MNTWDFFSPQKVKLIVHYWFLALFTLNDTGYTIGQKYLPFYAKGPG